MNRIEISLTADSIPDGYSADLSIIIDVLRASSVIVTALSHEVPFVIPASTIDGARSYKEQFPEALLAGEREAVRIEGFDKGNSPFEYMDKGKQNPLILSTTNGTKALERSKASKEIIIACFLNVSQVAKKIACMENKHIHIACAGTNGQFSLDDYLMAGALIFRLNPPLFQLDDLGIAACQLYKSVRGNLPMALETTKHYNTLKNRGFQKDLDYCLQEDIYPIIPQVIDKDLLKIAIHQII